MNKLSNYLIGPELLWVFFYMLVVLLIKMTHSPIKSMDSFWVNTAFIIPLVLIPITFGLYYIPGVIRPWLLLRIWIVGIVGGHYVLSKSLSAHSEQGPGVGTAYIMGMGIIFIVLIIGSIFAVIKFR
ncbi:MAG: hypothetical protein IPP15_04605 [Saprospiraceae bacterium]|uniref:Uncharacterized protein n=1 Tax=Candidatus Opimibacter skivensis TaxID=2982028 RepID=A0A9D7STY2_9BACT|nr:hypothetical protein [Candidatus Opimibacter skivensis]